MFILFFNWYVSFPVSIIKLVMHHYLVVSIENSKEVLSLNPPEEDAKTESDSENEEVDIDVIRGRQKLSWFNYRIYLDLAQSLNLHSSLSYKLLIIHFRV